MSHNLKTLLTVAAELRAVGHSWESVAERVHRRPRTCQSWPSRYRDGWADLYRSAQRKRFDETSAETHAVLKMLLRSTEDRTRLKAVEIWLKCGANAFGLQGKMVAPGPDPAAGPAADPLAAAYQDMADTRARMDRHRAHLGLAPLTDDEFLAEYEAELTALLSPPPRRRVRSARPSPPSA